MKKTVAVNIAVLSALVSMGRAWGQQYVVTDLGTLPLDALSEANGINDKGQVVGDSAPLINNTGANNTRPFLYSGGAMSDLGTLGGSYSIATGINDIGQVIGYSATDFFAGDALHHAFMYSDGVMRDINGGFGNFTPAAINDSGQVAGYTVSVSGYHAVLYSGGVMKDINPSTDYYSLAYGIDSAGKVVGVMTRRSANPPYSHAFLYSANDPAGAMKDIDTLNSSNSAAKSVSGNGLIVGDIGTPSGHHVFLYSGNAMTDIGAYKEYDTVSTGINDSGQVVGFVWARATPLFAITYSDGKMQNLNDLIDPASGWHLSRAAAINNAGQIVGYGNIGISSQRHAFLLTPIPQSAISAIRDATPVQPTYGSLPAKESGKNNLILVTHGWSWKVLYPYGPPSDVDWLVNMTNVITQYATAHSLSDWQVVGYRWLRNSWTWTAPDALYNAKGEGVNLGSALAVQRWRHVHLIGHSAGAEVIAEAAQWIKSVSPSTTAQCTFLDPYVGNDNAGVANYGYQNDWSDNYFSHDVTGDVTEQPLINAYNVNVTQLGPKTGVTKFRSQNGTMETCTRTVKYHGWSVDFYLNTITGNGVDSDYTGFGFPLSKEAGGWSSGIPNYVPGNGTSGRTELVRVLGTPNPTCVNDIQLSAPSWPSLIPNFGTFPTIQSDTGSNQKGNGTLNLTPGSPSWVATVIAPTNSMNTVSFDAQFSGVSGSEDMLTVLWDDKTIGSVDERVALSGLQRYSLMFDTAVSGSTHVLSFRLDPYTSYKSSILLTNVVLTQVGPSQPFTLSATSDTVNGATVWQLTGDAGFAYGIQASTNLATAKWIDIAELINTNGVVRFYDQDSTNYPMRFYRAYVPIKQ